MEHLPVLSKEVLELLDLKNSATVIDGTLGLGGHAAQILERVGKQGKLIAFEQDERNLKEAQKRLKPYAEQIIYIHDNFRHLKSRVTGEGIDHVDAILLDLGLSSPHVDEAERGFSFSQEGPLDMRFDPRNELTAAVVVNTYSQDQLKQIFYQYGEEKMAPKIARKICERRQGQEFSTTEGLADFIASFSHQKRGKKSHPATQVFQALRIEVNEELAVLEEVLPQAFELLAPGRRIAIISYHSLEDRMVKQYFKSLIRPKITDPQELLYRTHGDPLVEAITKKPVTPTDEELAVNPRSRSAKLRVYQKI